MQRIASFTIKHMQLEPGVYVSRVDRDVQTNATITTFDIRITRPNREPVISTAAAHTIEHLGATYLRNSTEWGSKIVYFGPMGCRTGFYLVLFGQYESVDVVGLVTHMFEFIRDFRGEQQDIPGAKADECGNYLDHNLSMAKWYAGRFLDEILYGIDESHMHYPA